MDAMKKREIEEARIRAEEEEENLKEQHEKFERRTQRRRLNIYLNAGR